ncbi:LysE family translocator [Flavihumibacter rivuli]|uniref:LysE family translocator n=1 Tax=Flavihumibacter rivuli TaxID=2838156 RepID=UPI001BDE77CB|nr:LysE family transporter [Flavihumibacter rivuli]ULQ57860.1 LysE family translocator [Flavihumibacter rivuli]
MIALFKIFGAGMLISFLGSLPLGTLNISAMQIAVQENTRRALAFAAGVALVEIIYVRLSLKGVDWIMSNQRIFYILEWVTVVLFLVLGISSIRAAMAAPGERMNILLDNKMNRFFLGLSMSAVNPVQIPFWFLWSSYLFSIHLLQSTTLAFNVYTLGIGIGTVTGLLLFIYGGKWLVRRMNAGQKFLNILVGIVFLLSAGIQCYRVVTKPQMEIRSAR